MAGVGKMECPFEFWQQDVAAFGEKLSPSAKWFEIGGQSLSTEVRVPRKDSIDGQVAAIENFELVRYFPAALRTRFQSPR
jgi:hypothetical protein